MSMAEHTPTFATHTAEGEAGFLAIFRPGLAVTIRRGGLAWDGTVRKAWATGPGMVGGMMVTGPGLDSAFAFDPRNSPQTVTVYL